MRDDGEEDEIVPGPQDPDAPPVKPADPPPTDRDTPPQHQDLDTMLALLQAYDVEYTLVIDEAGSTIEISGGNRGTVGFAGHGVAINYGPDESFLFISVVKL